MINKHQTQGFALIGFVILLTLLAILASIAIPKYAGIPPNNSSLTTSVVADALTSASTNNYALRSLNHLLGSTITNCTDTASLLHGGLPAGYAITSNPITAGASARCTLTGPDNTQGTFTAIGIG